MSALTELCYFGAAALFLLSLRWLSSPRTALAANFVSMAAMTLAVGPTAAELLWPGSAANALLVERLGGNALVRFALAVGGGLAVGGAIGWVSARKVKMTAMPQMVGLYNGLGGAASLLVAAVELLHRNRAGEQVPALEAAPIFLSVVIGGVCFTGSMAAFCKLQEVLVSGRPFLFPGQHLLNLTLLLSAVGLSVAMALGLLPPPLFFALIAVSLVLGWLVVIPIGGADMPVVVSLMNSYSGMAVTATGFVLRNNVLIIVGSFVGASGIILTRMMCQAMNRSFVNVMFGGFGAATGPAAVTGVSGALVKEATVDDAALMLSGASSVIIVPGYGMAVAQAQHAVHELGELCEQKGAKVRYAIHPVAGRMPGHMNVLLAEADVPYDQLFDLEQINDDFATADVVVVVGANDVVNPAAKTDPKSPIYGMPVFNCELAKAVLVLKRGMSAGFAGIDNALFVQPNTMMVFGDAKQTLARMITSLREG